METKVQTVETSIALLHRSAQEKKDAAVAASFDAVRAAVECGALLEKERARRGVNFKEWLAEKNPEVVDWSDRYISALKKRRALGDADPDFATLKQLYLTCDLMPQPPAAEPTNAGAAPTGFMRWSMKIDQMIFTMKQDEKQKLKAWAQEILKRI
jgi:hypothetical protein